MNLQRYNFKSSQVCLYGFIVITISFILTLLISSTSLAYSPEQLDRFMAKQSKEQTTQPLQTQSKQRNQMSPQFLEGRTTVQSQTTSSRSPLVYGSIPSWCDDIGVIIFADTANLDTGEGAFVFFSEAGEIYLDSNGYWSLNLQSNGLGLINGKYNVYVSSKCGYGGYDDPLYADIHFDGIFIIPTACNTNCTPVHRFYNTKNGAHFYTSSENEKRNVLYNMPGYRYEGIVNFARGSQESPAVAVHRFYHKTNGTHVYTANQAEASNINDTMSSTYRYEGIAYYSFNSDMIGYDTVAVHRFYKFKQGVHFFTSNQSEASTVNNTMSSQYRYEGIAYYNTANN